MSKLRILFHLMLADFLERTRSYGFLVLLLFTIFVTYLFIPDIHMIQVAGLNLGGYRAIYNSAWIGSMTALMMGEFFPLFSFYLLKGSVERDRCTGVGQILASTPLSKGAYMFGKWLSNIAVVGAMVLAIIAASVLLQLIRAEESYINLWAIASPFIIVLFPTLTIIAAFAVLFDSLPALRGGVGNVIFFFVYLLMFLPFDPQGNTIIYPSIYRACAAVFTGCNPSRQIDVGMPPLSNFPAFRYEGVDWTMGIFLTRFSLILIGLGIAYLAAFFFHRFDPARSDKSFQGNFSSGGISTPQTEIRSDNYLLSRKNTPFMVLAPATRSTSFSNLTGRLRVELRLIFKGVHWVWFLAAFGVWFAQILTPLDAAHLYILPIALVLPLTIWSNLGVREVRHRVSQIVFSAPYPLMHQFSISWLAGVWVALVLTSPVLVRIAMAGRGSAFGALLVGIIFIPTLAMALGCWSNGSKLFEGGYLFFWYLASVHGVPIFDFMGRIPHAREMNIPILYLGLTILLMVVGVFGRKRQVIK